MPNARSSVAFPRPWTLAWILAAGWIDRNRAQRVFDSDPWTGWFGRNPTLLAAYVWCFFVCWPVTMVELAGIPLMLLTAIRIFRNYRFIPSIILQPLLLCAAIFGLVQLASGLWTIDRDQWAQQAGAMRWIWSLFMLWPFVEQRRSLLLAAALGCFVGNLTQVSQFLHLTLHWPTPTWPRAADRVSGWWPPVVCGTVLIAALGWHLPAAMLPGPAKTRILAAGAALVTFAGILASGTRGAWLAGAALIPLCAVASLIVRHRSAAADGLPARGRVIPAVIVAVLILVVGAVAWTRLGESISRRVALAREEISAAVQHGEYRTDTGARIGMATWAMDLFKAHPVIGVGAGSFRPAAQALLASRGIDPATQAVHDHAHNALLHIAATTGLLGLVPALGVIIFAFRNAWVLGTERASNSDGYEWGPAGALAGLLLVSVFDPVHINAQTSALLAVLLSLCPSFAPAAAERPIVKTGEGVS